MPEKIKKCYLFCKGPCNFVLCLCSAQPQLLHAHFYKPE